jgi:FSR family fosmidomycin resistance protein-like MFS transporter
VFGTLAAAWPLIRGDLGLSYAEVGLLLAVPGVVGSLLDPLVGVAGDTRRRRTLLLAGGVCFALSIALIAGSTGFGLLLLALVLGNPASGAFVSLAQASLMDLAPESRERNMARWTLAGSIGVVAAPVLLAAAVAAGVGWRAVPAALAVVAVVLTLSARRAEIHGGENGESLGRSLRGALRTVWRRDVARWLVILEASDLMLDVLHGFLALYFVDVAGLTSVEAALALTVWTAAGLVGDAALLVVLRRVRGTAYLRATAAAALFAYPLFLVVPTVELKLVLLALLGLLNSGWYAIPKAGLYSALPGRSGTAIAVGSVGGLAGAALPLALGLVAQQVGLAPTMWLLLLSPLVLLVLVPRSPVEGQAPN